MANNNKNLHRVGLGSTPTNGYVEVKQCDKYISGVTGKIFELHAKYGENQLKFDCCSNNVIYLMTCRICLKQYVGQTRQTLRERMNQHRHNLNGNKNVTILNKH